MLSEREEDRTIPANRFSRNGLAIIPVTTVNSPTMNASNVAGTCERNGISEIIKPRITIDGIIIFLLIVNWLSILSIPCFFIFLRPLISEDSRGIEKPPFRL